MKFSANLGFLWADLPLPEAIHAAKKAGFDAVECHWPYDVDAQEVKGALDETGLPMLGLNTFRGNPGENGLTALPGREDEARAAIDQALTYALTTGTQAVHIMSGFATGAEAYATFVKNLRYAATEAAKVDKTLLIEPLNPYDAPGYFLNSTELATQIIDEVAAPNLKLMFDCYHVQLIQGDLTHRLTKLLPYMGSVADRGGILR